VRTFASGLAFAVLALLPGCGAAERPAADAVADSPVYRLAPVELPGGDCGDPSCTIARFVVWVAPETGWSRTEIEDGTGFETTDLFAHGARMVDHGDGPPDIRAGLAGFVGRSAYADVVEAVRRHGPLEPGDRVEAGLGGTTIDFVVEEKLELASEAAAALFSLPGGGIRSRTLGPGAPSALVAAYWLGPRYGDREAVTAVERDAVGEDGYFVFYGAGPESADALQIASTPRAGSTAPTQGRGESRVVALANGERARLVAMSPADGAYVVATTTTLVGFVAGSPDEAERMAAALRPVTP